VEAPPQEATVSQDEAPPQEASPETAMQDAIVAAHRSGSLDAVLAAAGVSSRLRESVFAAASSATAPDRSHIATETVSTAHATSRGIHAGSTPSDAVSSSGSVPETASAAAVEPDASMLAAEAGPSTAASSSASTASMSAVDRFADYRMRQEARRSEARRRRAERLVALNAALDAHAQVIQNSLVGVDAAGDSQFVEDHTITSVWAGPEDTQCVICCEDLGEGEAVRTLRCGHVYHKECVDVWLRRSRLCCLCKQPIDGSVGEP